MQLPGRALWRGFVIVSIFVFASMLLLMVVGVGHDSWLEWWTELLIVPGFALGLVVAIADFIRQRGRERE